MNIIYGIVLLDIISGIIVGVLIHFAPEGYQDENGFHYGRKNEKK